MHLSADVQKTADAPDALAAIARSVFLLWNAKRSSVCVCFCECWQVQSPLPPLLSPLSEEKSIYLSAIEHLRPVTLPISRDTCVCVCLLSFCQPCICLCAFFVCLSCCFPCASCCFRSSLSSLSVVVDTVVEKWELFIGSLSFLSTIFSTFTLIIIQFMLLEDQCSRPSFDILAKFF